VNFLVEKEWMGGVIYGKAAAKAQKGGPGCMIFCGTGFAWHLSNLEDFADFYHDGAHRADDPFGPMEKHSIERKGIELARNIDHFASRCRHVEVPKMEEFQYPVRGPHFLLPQK
jgi:hypothetical protein